MSQTLITVEIPGEIAHCCWPNSRCHWRSKARDTKTMRDAAFFATRSALAASAVSVDHDNTGTLKTAWKHVLGPRKRQRDIDNSINATKSIQDGVFEALGLDDRLVRQVEVSWTRGTTSATVLTISTIDDHR